METKMITAKQLQVGQEIRGTFYENAHSMFRAYIKEITPTYVVVEMWEKGGSKKRINADYMFEVEMSEKEFQSKYRDKAKEVLNALKNKLHRDEIGCHEMWNSWLFGNAYEIAKTCEKEHMRIIGYCTDIVPKQSMVADVILDIGVCAEYEDGERIWCHYSSEYLTDLICSFE